jgi:uncharacterized DUF497 family protein
MDLHHLMGLEFEWDPVKAKINLEKHGVSFEEAMTVFGDDDSITMLDFGHSDEEDRFMDLGRSKNGNTLIVAHKEREKIRFELSRQDQQIAKNEDFMKKTRKHVTNGKSEEMLSNYNFTGGVRGKYAKRYREDVTIHLLGDSEDTRLVVLDEDIGKVFPDAKSVNAALRHHLRAMSKAKRKQTA